MIVEEETLDKRGKVTSPDILTPTRVRPMLSANYARSTSPSLALRQIHSHPWEYSSVEQPQPSTSAGTDGTPHKWQQTIMERYSAAVPYNKTSFSKGLSYHSEQLISLDTRILFKCLTPLTFSFQIIIYID